MRTDFIRTASLMKLCGAFAGLLLCGACVGLNGADRDWEAKRQQALDRKRVVIYNTDGCDAVYYPKSSPVTPEDFKKERLTYTKGTEVNSLFYCVNSGGYGHLLYDTKVADVFSNDPDDTSQQRHNITAELIRQGTSPVALAEEYAKDNGLEFFASLRFNDNHDVIHSTEHPSFCFSKFKKEHPEAMFGSEKNRPPYCGWAAMDFMNKDVQKRTRDMVQEICERFDVDGIEYDFMRHIQLFRTVAMGGVATEEELAEATRFMGELRDVTETIGKRRGRPILIAIRVPDSVEYCKAVGIDLEKWMATRLFDMLITTGYFQMNRWKYSADLGHKYGLKCYASLDESRVSGFLPYGNRNARQCYNARALTARMEGMDGVYLFNVEYGGLATHSNGEIDTLRFMDKIYYVTERGSGGYPIGYFLRGGESYRRLPIIEPGEPAQLDKHGELAFPLVIGDDLSTEEAKAQRPTVSAMLRCSSDKASFRLQVNGKVLEPVSRDGRLWSFTIPTEDIRCGENAFAILSDNTEDPQRKEIMKGDALLVGNLRGPWRRFYEQDADGESIVDGAYRLKDGSTDNHIGAALFYPIHQSPGQNMTAYFELKVEKSSRPEAIVARLANGEFVETVTFEPETVRFSLSGKSAAFRTDDRFHAYVLAIRNGHVTLHADGALLLETDAPASVFDAKNHMTGYTENIAGLNTEGLTIGSISVPGTGVSYWRHVALETYAIQIEDVAVAISYTRLPPPDIQRLATCTIRETDSVVVANGRPAFSSNVTNCYEERDMTADGFDALKLRHTNRNPHFDLSRSPLMITPPDIVLAEWTVQPLEDGPDGKQLAFLVAVSPRRSTDHGNWEIEFIQGVSAAQCSLGNIPMGVINPKEENTFRIAIDTRRGVGAIWCNGKLLLYDKIYAGNGRKEPFCHVGDASGRVMGLVRFKRFVMGVPLR